MWAGLHCSRAHLCLAYIPSSCWLCSSLSICSGLDARATQQEDTAGSANQRIQAHWPPRGREGCALASPRRGAGARRGRLGRSIPNNMPMLRPASSRLAAALLAVAALVAGAQAVPAYYFTSVTMIVQPDPTCWPNPNPTTVQVGEGSSAGSPCPVGSLAGLTRAATPTPGRTN